MAENENEATTDEQPAGSSGGGILPWIIVGFIASGMGAAVPIGLTLLAAPQKQEPKQPVPYDATPAASDMMFHPYGEVTVNLDEGRMNRYLRLKIALHIRKSDEAIITKALTSKNLIIRNWLISHLSDKNVDEIRGKAGQNMLRREIRDYFNATLFKDNYERVYDVLFEEFNVQ